VAMEKIRQVIAYKNYFEDFDKALALMNSYYEEKNKK